MASKAFCQSEPVKYLYARQVVPQAHHDIDAVVSLSLSKTYTLDKWFDKLTMTILFVFLFSLLNHHSSTISKYLGNALHHLVGIVTHTYDGIGAYCLRVLY